MNVSSFVTQTLDLRRNAIELHQNNLKSSIRPQKRKLKINSGLKKTIFSSLQFISVDFISSISRHISKAFVLWPSTINLRCRFNLFKKYRFAGDAHTYFSYKRSATSGEWLSRAHIYSR